MCFGSERNMVFLSRFLILIALLGCFSSASFAQGTGYIVPLQIWQGDQASLLKQTNLTVRSQEEWAKLWANTEKKAVVQPLKKGQMAVAVFTGSKSTFGHRVTIADIAEKPGQIEVMYQVMDPEQTRVSAVNFQSSPWVIAIVPYSEKPVVFKETSKFQATFSKMLKGIGSFFDKMLFSGIHKKETP